MTCFSSPFFFKTTFRTVFVGLPAFLVVCGRICVSAGAAVYCEVYYSLWFSRFSSFLSECVAVSTVSARIHSSQSIATHLIRSCFFCLHFTRSSSSSSSPSHSSTWYISSTWNFNSIKHIIWSIRANYTLESIHASQRIDCMLSIKTRNVKYQMWTNIWAKEKTKRKNLRHWIGKRTINGKRKRIYDLCWG